MHYYMVSALFNLVASAVYWKQRSGSGNLLQLIGVESFDFGFSFYIAWVAGGIMALAGLLGSYGALCATKSLLVI